jgi:hypothetical protein
MDINNILRSLIATFPSDWNCYIGSFGEYVNSSQLPNNAVLCLNFSGASFSETDNPNLYETTLSFNIELVISTINPTEYANEFLCNLLEYLGGFTYYNFPTIILAIDAITDYEYTKSGYSISFNIYLPEQYKEL